MRPRYCISEDRKTVLCDSHNDTFKTVVLGEERFPANSETIAGLMNVAFERGYQYAQAEIRRALGILK